jgi:hypothetical protein
MAAAATGRAGLRTRRSWLAATVLAAALSLSAPGAQAQSLAQVGHGFAAAGEDAFDLIVLRPAGTVALLVGSVFFVASVPVVAPYHAVKGSIEGIRGSFDVFVYPPYEYTALRDLGDF